MAAGGCCSLLVVGRLVVGGIGGAADGAGRLVLVVSFERRHLVQAHLDLQALRVYLRELSKTKVKIINTID